MCGHSGNSAEVLNDFHQKCVATEMILHHTFTPLVKELLSSLLEANPQMKGTSDENRTPQENTSTARQLSDTQSSQPHFRGTEEFPLLPSRRETSTTADTEDLVSPVRRNINRDRPLHQDIDTRIDQLEGEMREVKRYLKTILDRLPQPNNGQDK